MAKKATAAAVITKVIIMAMAIGVPETPESSESDVRFKLDWLQRKLISGPFCNSSMISVKKWGSKNEYHEQHNFCIGSNIQHLIIIN